MGWEWSDSLRVSDRGENGATSRLTASSAHTVCVVDVPAELSESEAGDTIDLLLSSTQPTAPSDADIVLLAVVVSHSAEGLLLSAGGMVVSLTKKPPPQVRARTRPPPTRPLPTREDVLAGGAGGGDVFVTVRAAPGKRPRGAAPGTEVRAMTRARVAGSI